MDDKLGVHEIVLQRLKFAKQAVISGPLDPDAWSVDLCESVLGGLAASLFHRVYGEKVEPIVHEWPATWWDGLKRALGLRHRMIRKTVRCARLFPDIKAEGLRTVLYQQVDGDVMDMPRTQGKDETDAD